jgi:hypothetical protein
LLKIDKTNEGNASLGCGAFHEDDIKHLHMKYPKIVPSLKYYDDDRN